MTYIFEIPDAEVAPVTKAIQKLSDEVERTSVGSLRYLQPPKPPTAAQQTALRVLAEPLQPGQETAEEMARRIYAARQTEPMLRSALFGNDLPELSKAEQRAMLAELSAPLPEGTETAEEMIARIYGDRRDALREVEL